MQDQQWGHAWRQVPAATGYLGERTNNETLFDGSKSAIERHGRPNSPAWTVNGGRRDAETPGSLRRGKILCK